MRFSLLGPGRAGSSLARALRAAGHEAIAVAGRRPEIAQQLARELGAQAVEPGDLLAGVDLVILAVPDGALAEAAAAMAARGRLASGQVAAHLSGALPAEVLAPLRGAGAVLAFHPLHTFPTPASALPPGTLAALEGDAAALTVGEELARSLGMVPVRIRAESKPVYHAAATLACQGVAGALAAAAAALAAAGFPRAQGEAALCALARAFLEGAGQEGLAAALTGPVARGDEGTSALHRKALAAGCPDVLPVYVELERWARRLTPRPPASGGRKRG